MQCCGDQSSTVLLDKQTITFALAGNPNSGKTTLFNALTGLRQKVGNYPGVTVEKKTGRMKLPDGRWANLIDLPGAYSIISRSPDERIAMQVLRGLRSDTPAPDAVIAVVDASNLQRNLYLLSQLIELGRPLVVALNMVDVAARRNVVVDAQKLQACLGVPVVPVVGHKKKGIRELLQAVTKAQAAPLPQWSMPQAMHDELTLVGGGLAILCDGLATHASPVDHYRAVAERLLIGDYSDDLKSFSQHEPVASLLKSSLGRLKALGIDPMQADIEAHYRWIDSVTDQAVIGHYDAKAADALAADEISLPHVSDHKDKPAAAARPAPMRTWTERIDSVLIHKVWGLLFFAGIMGALFYSLFFVADPIMGTIEDSVAWLGDLITPLLPQGPIADLWTGGIVAGVGSVVVFVPQIAFLFLFLAILEDSGYLARAAFLMDRLLRGVGLHGKSFIPLLSSFACAIPGIMAARTIEDRNDRLATIAVAPFMSCSARLPVYILLIGTFFSGFSAFGQAGIMLGLYVLGIVAAAAVAFVFRRTLLKGHTSAFILELPTYKVPQVSQILRTVAVNSWAFLHRAGTIIFVLSIILWAMAYYPRLPEQNAQQVAAVAESKAESLDFHYERPAAADTEMESAQSQVEPMTYGEAHDAFIQTHVAEAIEAAQLEYSISGRIGHLMEPALRPLGYNWKMGVGLVAAFAAREVFVSYMGIVYSVGQAEDNTADLQSVMKADTYANGQAVWTPAVALSLLVWFVLALQCMSTVAIVRRETGGWTWPIFMLIYMNGLAYLASMLVYQVGSRWG
ncbi:MAG: ferrous iron transport protein B [Phycisphaerales bacterium]|nr:ferrous iron transport protein B [Phycisphaerales bacterium]